ncbi:hypothetical protein ACFVTF_05895 [Kitasatospora sp. NPDC057940]|uniref:hypothetical protein n=1 Tax=Kitasatospora sp. NPDC057940 TaxID=3346285 RepID=UPI0036D992A8
MAGRHRRPPEPQLPPDTGARRRAITDQQPVVEEDTATSPTNRTPYAYRTAHRPDSGTDRHTASAPASPDNHPHDPPNPGGSPA